MELIKDLTSYEELAEVPLLKAKQEYSFLNEAHWIPKSTASYYVDLKLLLVGSNHTLKFT